jgi:mRNA interferase MazF
MTDTVEFGEVYVCVFPFTSGQAAKARPVLVLMDLGPDCLVCRITSVSHRGFLDVEVDRWQKAGLDKPSTIRLSRLVTVEKSILRVRIGRLNADDANSVRTLWNTKFRL